MQAESARDGAAPGPGQLPTLTRLVTHHQPATGAHPGTLSFRLFWLKVIKVAFVAGKLGKIGIYYSAFSHLIYILSEDALIIVLSTLAQNNNNFQIDSHIWMNPLIHFNID